MGRNAKPAAVHIAEGNPNRKTKAELLARQENEIKLGRPVEMKMPAYVREDKVAAQKWRELVKQYKEAADNNVELITSSDAGILARYCMTYSEYVSMIKARAAMIDDIGADDDGKKERMSLIDRQRCESLLNQDINKARDALLKMEDRLFLSPLAKIRNVPKSAKQEKDEFGDMFD